MASPWVLAQTFFDVREFAVEGVHSVEAAAVQAALAPFTGPARTLEDIDQAAQALQQLYADRGYQTVEIDVPNQDVARGVIRIVVRETLIRRVTVQGADYFSLAAIKQTMPSLQEGKPLNLLDLQRDSQMVNRLSSDLQVVPSVEASPTPGQVDVLVSVSDAAPLHGGVEVTNYHSFGTTPTRLAADVSYANLWQRQHQMALQMQVTPEAPDEVQVLALSYLAPMRGNSAKWATYAIRSQSDLATVDEIRVVGEGSILGSRWVQTLAQTRRVVQSLSSGFDWKSFDNSISSSATSLTYLSFSSQYSVVRRGESHSDSFSFGLTFSNRDWVNDSAEFSAARGFADASFTYLKSDWKHSYKLPAQWSLSHRLRGQFSSAPLVSNEQISAGGIASLPAYYESQNSGDSGYLVDLGLETPPLVEDWRGLDKLNLRFYLAYSDLQLRSPAIGQQPRSELANAGLGLFAVAFGALSLKLDYAQALMDASSLKLVDGGLTVPVVDVAKGEERLLGSLRYDF